MTKIAHKGVQYAVASKTTKSFLNIVTVTVSSALTVSYLTKHIYSINMYLYSTVVCTHFARTELEECLKHPGNQSPTVDGSRMYCKEGADNRIIRVTLLARVIGDREKAKGSTCSILSGLKSRSMYGPCSWFDVYITF